MAFANLSSDSLARLVSSLLDCSLSLFFPQSCQLCHAEVESRKLGIACRCCWDNTLIFTEETPICYKCSRLLRSTTIGSEKTFCHLCENDYFDLARSVGLYEKALMRTILYLKTVPFLASYAQELLYKAFKRAPFQDADLIIPVPLSKARLAERGFNQAEIIANALANRAKIPIDVSSLIRNRHTKKHRPGMDKIARQRLVEAAFLVSKSDKLAGKNVVLVDDVLTSGATASNCAKVLKQHGAAKVYVLTLARATH
jgi:ComF family protein